jgi:hypothetical protein
MIENINSAEQYVKAIKSKDNFRHKEQTLGILTPMVTDRFEQTGF